MGKFGGNFEIMPEGLEFKVVGELEVVSEGLEFKLNFEKLCANLN